MRALSALCAGLAADIANEDAVADIVCDLESMLMLFDMCVGKSPALSNPFCGRVRYEIAFLPGAAGLAGHGHAGVAVGPAFIKAMIDGHAAGRPYIDHVFYYESTRNYIFPEEFTVAFDYRLAESPDCWGWVRAPRHDAVVVRCRRHAALLCKSPHVTSHHLTSRHITLPSPSHHVTSRHVTSRHVTSRHVTSRHVAPLCTTLNRSIKAS